MSASSRMPGCLLALIVTVMAAAWWMWPSYFHYRITVEVDTPNGPVTGSSVHELRVARKPALLPDERTLAIRFKGEAVAVDLGQGQTLFALITKEPGGGFNGLMGPVLNTFAPGGGGRTALFKLMDKLEDLDDGELKADMTPENYPLLVRFRDIRDPRTVEIVDPDDLEAAFGPGYTLSRISVAVTNDPVTTGIEKRLEWLSEYPEPALKPGNFYDEYSPVASLRHGDFRTGRN